MSVVSTVAFKNYPAANSEEICLICRDPLNEALVGHGCAKKANHVFHKTCMQGWVKENQSCPTCRLRIDDNSIVRVLDIDISAIRRNANGEDLYDPDIREKQITASMLVSIFGCGAILAMGQLTILFGMNEDLAAKLMMGVGIVAFAVGSLFINKLIRFF